jgi:hypothetical protein
LAGITRRAFIGGGTAAAILCALYGRARAEARNLYRGAIVIDGLGSFGNSKGIPGAPLTDGG